MPELDTLAAPCQLLLLVKCLDLAGHQKITHYVRRNRAHGIMLSAGRCSWCNTGVACTCPTALQAGVVAVILKSSSVVGNLLILCMIILMRVQASHECIRDDRTESQYNLSFIVMERCWLDVRWLPVVSRLCSDIHLTAIPIALAVVCSLWRQRTFSSESMLMHTLPRFAWVTRHCTLVIAEQGHECRVLPSSHHLHTAQCLMN